MYRWLLFLLVCFELSAEQIKVDVAAKSAILINAKTGAILFEKEAHLPLFPASITKVATALYALEKRGGALDEAVAASHDCLTTVASHLRYAANVPPYRLEPGGSHINLFPDEVLTLRVLLYGLLLSSGNDAANVIAKHIAGDVGRFMEELNFFLASKGLKETFFLNPHGLHHPDHRTTAHDMAFITKEALKHPFFREAVKTVRAIRPQSNKQAQNFFVQSNRLLKPGQYFYSKAIGVKTGHTSQAGYTLVAAASHGERTLITALLGCPDADARYRDAIKLFEAAFGQKATRRTLFTKEHDRFSRSIKGAKRELNAQLQNDLVWSYFPAEEPPFKAQIEWTESKLPISKGQLVGYLQLVTDKRELLQREPLLAIHDVEKSWGKVVVDFCVRYRTLLLLIFLGLNIIAALFYLLKKPQKVV